MTNIRGYKMNSEINGNMLVKEIVLAIANKELKVKDLAEKYGTSDRTIQSKIKKLGFSWEPKERIYEFIGNDNSVYNLAIDDVFTSKSAIVNNSVAKVEKEVKKNSETKPEIKSKSAIKNDSDNIDMLLSGKKVKAKKEYRGFYFDSDVLAIIDAVNPGVKSELVNECLRKVFKDKGLL